MKYTKSEVQGMFSRLAKAMKREDLTLDYVSCYGGYVIEQIDENGGVNHPYGAMRRSAREMYLSMHMTTQALEDIRYKQEQLNKYEIAS